MSSLKLVVISALCRYAKTVQRIFKYSDIQYNCLTLDKKLNCLIYGTLFGQHIRELQTPKNSPVFGPSCRLPAKATRKREKDRGKHG